MMDWNLKQLGAFFFAALLILTLVLLAFRIKEKEEDKWINLAVIVLGLCLGWLLGIFIAPYKGEETHFKELASAVAAFLSGYLVSKVDGLITKLLSPDQVMNPVAGFRVISAISSLVLSLIATYVARAYI